MIKPTPNPPENAPPYKSFDSKKLNDAAERAVDHYHRVIDNLELSD